MKKRIGNIVILTVFILSTMFVFSVNSKAATNPDYTKDVPLDAVHFPDEKFREQLGRYVDANKDGILSNAERESIHYLYFQPVSWGNVTKCWYTDMKYLLDFDSQQDNEVWDKNKCVLRISNYKNYSDRKYQTQETFDVTGVEYFYNLQEVAIYNYDGEFSIVGSFYKNTNLRKLLICATGKTSYEDVMANFPVFQLTYLHLEGVNISKINTDKLAKLQVLRVKLKEGSNQRLDGFDVSKLTNIKELELAHILPRKLDLRKCRKLTSLKLYSGKEKRGKDYNYFIPEKNQRCKVIFPKKNKITELRYFTQDKNIDISYLAKLEDFDWLKTTKVKVKSSWIRKTFTKKKWGCALVKSGKFLRKVKAAKKKKYTIL